MSLRTPLFVTLLLTAIGVAGFPAKAQAGEIKKGLTFPSTALKGDMTFSLYLPDAYTQEPGLRFPVLYLLHGYGGNDREWIELGGVHTALDRMIAAGEIPPVIAVMPNGAKGWYVDSAALGGPGDYETAIAVDLVQHIDSHYRVLPERSGRAVAGLSMGGYGAFRMAFFHPNAFAATASLSGALHQTDNIPVSEQPLLMANLHQRAERKYHGAYGTPFNMNLFVARNPFTRIPDLSRMRTPPKILIMTGDDDFLNFYEGSCQLFVALRRARLQAELRVDNGGHDWNLWRAQLPEVVRFLTNAMKMPEEAPPATPPAVADSSAPALTFPDLQPVAASWVATPPAGSALSGSSVDLASDMAGTPVPPDADEPLPLPALATIAPLAPIKRADIRPVHMPAVKEPPLTAEGISLKTVGKEAGVIAPPPGSKSANAAVITP